MDRNTSKKNTKLLTIFLALVVSISLGCAFSTSMPSPQTEQKTLQPGEKIKGFLITEGKNEGEMFFWQMHPTSGVKPNETCVAIELGTKFNPSIGIYNDTHKGKLDAYWKDLKYELYIEDRQVDLQAFGTVHSVCATLGVIRYWNVVIVADKPGRITIHEVGKNGNQVIDDWTVYMIYPPSNKLKDGCTETTQNE